MWENFHIYIFILLPLYIFAKYLVLRIQNLPPTPYPFFPIIAFLYLRRPLYRSLTRCSDKHGPILFFQVGIRPVLVVSSPSLVEECLTKDDIVFANRPRLLVGKYIGFNYTTLVWAPYGDHLRILRRISSLQLLSRQRLQMLSSLRLEEVMSFIRVLNNNQNRILDMRAAFFELTLNGMLRMITGKQYNGENGSDVEEARILREIQLETFTLTGTLNVADFLPDMIKWVAPKGLEKKFIHLQSRREELVQNLIEGHRKSRKKGKDQTMIEVLLALQETEPEFYTDETIRGLLLVLLLATDSSVHTMEWALSLLLNHPQVLEKARKEIDNVVGQGRLINESDLSLLPYLGNLISETLRMYPPGPFLLPHESSKECTVGGFRVPPGTTLLMNIWAIHNDPKIWEDPREFKPERFEGFHGVRDRFKWMPFGFGRRGCPGEALALCVVGLGLGSLIQCFEWERVGEEMVDMTERGGFTLAKDQPLNAKCKRRPRMEKVLAYI